MTGRHEGRMLFIIDEAVGVDPMYFTTIKTMFKPGLCSWLVICNPTVTTSQVYQEELSGEWNVFSLSATEHPNIEAERRGEPVPVPNAVTVAMIEGWVRDWCTPLDEDDTPEPTDFEWPMGSGSFYRPGPEFESRCLGKWPSQGTYGVWSDALWDYAVTKKAPPPPILELPHIGCDVARFGDDKTEFHVRWGIRSLSHDAVSGWRTTEIAGRCIDLAKQYVGLVNQLRDKERMTPATAKEIPIKIDDDGVGGGVVDVLVEQGYNAIPIRSGTKAMSEGRYPNKRSELWFSTQERARAGMLSLGKLDAETLRQLKSQAMAPTWKPDSMGRRVVEPKDTTKEKIGRSPDGMDALNMAYYEGVLFEAPPTIENPVREPRKSRESNKRKLFGRR